MCVADLVQAHVRAQPAEAKQLCSTVSAVSWRDECYFRIAQTLPIPATPERLLTQCEAAGSFLRFCLYHCIPRYGLQLRESHTAADAFTQFAEFVVILPLREDKRMAWSQFTRTNVVANAIDPDWCLQLGSHQEECRVGLLEGHRREQSGGQLMTEHRR